MITFADEIEKVVVPHGVAADRLNRDLLKLVVDVYKRGIEKGANAPFIGDEEKEIWLKVAFEQVEKTKAALGD